MAERGRAQEHDRVLSDAEHDPNCRSHDPTGRSEDRGCHESAHGGPEPKWVTDIGRVGAAIYRRHDLGPAGRRDCVSDAGGVVFAKEASDLDRVGNGTAEGIAVAWLA